jgi:hypothetical protein
MSIRTSPPTPTVLSTAPWIFPELSTMAKASFGFGDVNSCLILKKWNPHP